MAERTVSTKMETIGHEVVAFRHANRDDMDILPRGRRVSKRPDPIEIREVSRGEGRVILTVDAPEEFVDAGFDPVYVDLHDGDFLVQEPEPVPAPSAVVYLPGLTGALPIQFRTELTKLGDLAAAPSIDLDLLMAILQEVRTTLTEAHTADQTLTEAQRSFLISSGSMTEERMQAAEKAAAEGVVERSAVRAHLETLQDTLTGADVAQMLGIDESRVRHRASKGGLYSFKSGNRNLYPRWQFGMDSKPLPGLKKVLAAIPESMHPARVRAIMTHERDGLWIDDAMLSPRDWLLSGGDVAKVEGIFRSVGLS